MLKEFFAKLYDEIKNNPDKFFYKKSSNDITSPVTLIYETDGMENTITFRPIYDGGALQSIDVLLHSGKSVIHDVKLLNYCFRFISLISDNIQKSKKTEDNKLAEELTKIFL